MIFPADRAAEKLCMDTLLRNEAVVAIYGRDRIYQGYVAPNTLASTNAYLLIQRVDAVTQDRSTGTPDAHDTLRLVRVQVDVSDVSYTDMKVRSELIKEVLKQRFDSCIDGDTYGTAGIGQKVFNVLSIDLNIYESATGDDYEGRSDQLTG